MNDSELALACLLADVGPSSGYGLTTLVRSRGMERWAGLSPTSIYKGLRHLVAAGLATSTPHTDKRGKGPAGALAELTQAGLAATRDAVGHALADAPEQSARFRIALSGIDLIGAGLASEQLALRSVAIAARLRDVRLAEDRERSDAVGRAALFDYVVGSLQHELAAIDHLVRTLQERTRP